MWRILTAKAGWYYYPDDFKPSIGKQGELIIKQGNKVVALFSDKCWAQCFKDSALLDPPPGG